MNKALNVLLCVALAGVCGAANIQSIRPPIRVACIGDSIAWGYAQRVIAEITARKIMLHAPIEKSSGQDVKTPKHDFR